MFDQPKVNRYDATKQGYDNKCSGANIVIICTALDHINATITLKTSNQPDFVDGYGRPQELLIDILYGGMHKSMTPSPLRNYWKLQLYPYSETLLKILSPNNSLQNTDGFLFIFKATVWLFIILGILISVVALKCTLKQSTTEAGLEFVRMLVSSSTLREPRGSSRRVLLIVMVLAAFVIGTSVQSILSAIITVPDRTTIDSLEDWLKSNIPIYGFSHRLMKLYNATTHKRFLKSSSSEDCANRFMRGENVACMYGDDVYPYYAPESSLIHISRENVLHMGFTYALAEDSPLVDKINWILSIINEGGIVQSFHQRDEVNYKKNSDEENLEESYSMANLISSFYMLLVGWALGVFAILIELIVGEKRKYNERLSFAVILNRIHIFKRSW